MKTKTISIGFTKLPVVDYAVGAAAVLGIRDSGKTVTAKGIAEQLMDNGIQIIVFDAVGKWQWMKVAGDRPNGRAYKVVVAGGRNPDLPLTPGSVAEIVRAALKERIPLVIDLFDRNLSKADWRRIVQAAIRIIHYENDGGAVHVFLEEAAEFCLDDKTEVLTQDGFKLIRDCRIGELVSSFNIEAQSYQWSKIKRIVKRPYVGKMVHLKTKTIDCLMTPDHRAVVRRYQHVPSRYKIYPPSFCEADKLPRSFIVPFGGAKAGSGIDIDDDFLRVIGWVATDGNWHSNKRSYICISQSEATVKRDISVRNKMRSVLVKLGATENKRQRSPRFIAGHKLKSKVSEDSTFFLRKELSLAVGAIMKGEIHRIPRQLISGLSTIQLKVLWEALLEGDGTSENGNWRYFYPGHEEGLADDFQEISLRLGIRTIKVFRNDQWIVSIASKKKDCWISKANQKSLADYDGKTWCITVDTGAFVARRNGKTFVTGNCPQRIEDGATYAEIEKLVRMGGNAAVGITLINQRSQEINKAVLDQCTTLVLGCQVGSRSIESVEKWMDRLDSLTAEAVAKKLPQLKAGQAFVWTRQNPEKPQFEHITMCRSLHPDRRTPETVLKTAKTTDTAEFVAKLSKAIPQLIEQAKANDPEQLKKRIVELERQAKNITPTVERTEVSILTADDRKKLEVILPSIEHFANVAESLKQQVASLQNGIGELRYDYMSIVHKLLSANNDRPNKILPAQRRSERPVSAPSAPVARDPIAIGGGMRRMLVALAQRSPLSDRQLGVRAGLSSKSGTFGTYLATLRQNGFIEGQRDALTISQDGLEALGDYEPLPTGQALLDYWLNRLIGGQMRMLSCLAAKYPQSMTDADLGDAAGVASNSGTFGTYLAGLRTLELVSGKRSALLASAELFD